MKQQSSCHLMPSRGAPRKAVMRMSLQWGGSPIEFCDHAVLQSLHCEVWKLLSALIFPGRGIFAVDGLQGMGDNTWFEVFPSVENEADCVYSRLSRRWRAKLRHCISDQLSNGKQMAWDLHFISLRYRSLNARLMTHSQDEKEQRQR